MTLLYRCDQCDYVQEERLAFRVEQITDEEDDDGDPIMVLYHLCSAECLSNLSTGLTLDTEAD